MEYGFYKLNPERKDLAVFWDQTQEDETMQKVVSGKVQKMAKTERVLDAYRQQIIVEAEPGNEND